MIMFSLHIIQKIKIMVIECQGQVISFLLCGVKLPGLEQTGLVSRFLTRLPRRIIQEPFKLKISVPRFQLQKGSSRVLDYRTWYQRIFKFLPVNIEYVIRT